MKIAIKSMISSKENFGSNLQNFALQKALRKNFPGLFVYSICWVKGLDAVQYSLHRFIKDNMNLGTFDENTDYLIFGSDQIWNYRYFVNCGQEHRIPEYTIASTHPEKLKCFSYASSTGGYTEDIFLSNKTNMDFVLNILNNFNYPGAIISFREKYSAKKWKSIADSLGFSHITTRYDIDPTFLLPSIEYLRLMKKPKIYLPENYSVRYMSGNMKTFQENKVPKKEYLEYMEKIKIDPDYKNAINLGDKELVNNIGIEGFFYLIKHAQKVFTDSFHAFVFFIILRNKNLIISPPMGDLRLENIKEILNIKIQNNRIINREEIEENIQKERERSLGYLKSLFQKENRTLEPRNVTCYLVQSMNLSDMLYSKSGGFTCALARYIFERGGFCYGVGYTSDYRKLEYKRLEKDSELSQIRGSKYFEIKGDNKFDKIKIDLEQGKLVLFIGVACYIDKLRKYLNKNYNNLITCALICNGYSTQSEWDKFYNTDLINIESISHSKLEGILLSYKNGSKKRLRPFDFYKQFCFKQNCYCDSCYKCNFKWPNINSDFVVGDNNSTLKVCCNEVILLTEKARQIFNELDDSGKIFKKDINFEHIKMNKMLFKSHTRFNS